MSEWPALFSWQEVYLSKERKDQVHKRMNGRRSRRKERRGGQEKGPSRESRKCLPKPANFQAHAAYRPPRKSAPIRTARKDALLTAAISEMLHFRFGPQSRGKEAFDCRRLSSPMLLTGVQTATYLVVCIDNVKECAHMATRGAVRVWVWVQSP